MEQQGDSKQKLDPIAQCILALTADGSEVLARDVAMHFFAEQSKKKRQSGDWHKFMHAVRQQAVYLARNGQIEITRRGEVVDPNDFRGLVRLRRPK